MNTADAAAVLWDVAIIGAGPAGSVAAYLLASQNRRVVLIEKSPWPRDKVCGGCLNADSVRMLCHLGLGNALATGQPINTTTWHATGNSATMPTPSSISIRRRDLDAALVTAAAHRGAIFLPATAARILPHMPPDHRLIELKNSHQTANVRAKIFLACDGIAGTCLRDEPWANWKIAPSNRIGLSTTLNNLPDEFAPNSIQMHVAPGGYVGIAPLPNNFLHLAAALDPNFCRQTGGAVEHINHVLASANATPFSNLELRTQNLALHGTPLLTRHRPHLAGHRVLAIGDACGYIEPFTGEGIAWAIHASIAAANLLLPTVEWTPDMPLRWQAIYQNTIKKRQRFCRFFRPLVHHPSLASLAILASQAAPTLPTFLSQHICQPHEHTEFSLPGAFA